MENKYWWIGIVVVAVLAILYLVAQSRMKKEALPAIPTPSISEIIAEDNTSEAFNLADIFPGLT